ncbi:hypothetical protein JB92DRAFT_2585016, partial [Gautieria morchelliformis]
LAYITDQDGVGIDGLQAGAIRASARYIWYSIHSKGMAPVTWSQASINAVQYYCTHMYDAHPDLHLCEGDWKVDLLAVDEFPGWIRSRRVLKA